MSYIIENEIGFSDYYYCEYSYNPLFDPHVHSHIEFVFVINGRLEVKIADKSYDVFKNTVVAIMPYEIHSYKTIDNCEVFIIACPIEYFNEYSKLISNKAFNPPYTFYDDIHFSIINKLKNEKFNDNIKKKTLIYYTLSSFMNNCTLVNKDAFEYDVYRRTLVYISKNYKEDLTLKNVALNVGVSVTHLSHVLNGDDKAGFSEIVNSLRIHHAKQLLQQRNLSISEIAYESGFGSIRNFNRIFKKYFNCTPADARKNI